jgi:hypothetical protein
MTRLGLVADNAPMTDRPADAPSPPDPGISERTGGDQRKPLVSELETEMERLRRRADALQAALDQRTLELRAFGAAGQAVQAAHRVLRQPSLLAKVPAAALRRIRGEGGAGPTVEHRRPSPPAPAARLPVTGSSPGSVALRDLGSLKVALIADEGLALALEPECHLSLPTPTGWRQGLAAAPPELLVVESAWRASRGAWQYRLAWYGHPLAIQLIDLRAITDWCAGRGIPTIFWETTGPAHRGRFDEAATLFDVILTSDPAGLGHYDSLPGRRATIVDLLEPGVQFRRHHPPGASTMGTDASASEASGRPVFVGSYDQARPLADREALDRLLAAGLDRGLRIYDTSGVAGPDGARFPEPFRAVSHDVASLESLPELLRSAGVVLVDAETGGEERLPPTLLEALACGAPVVVTPSPAIQARFNGCIPGSLPDDDPAAAIDRILAEPDEARRRIRTEILPVLARDFDIRRQLGRLASAAGIGTVPALATIAVTVLHDDPGQTAGLASALAGALAGPGAKAEILIGTTDWSDAGAPLADALRAANLGVPVRLVEHDPRAASAQRLERLAAITDVDWIAPWPEGGGFAGPDLLADLRLAIAFEAGDVVKAELGPLPRAVRRRSILATGWPPDRASDVEPSLVGVARPPR